MFWASSTLKYDLKGISIIIGRYVCVRVPGFAIHDHAASYGEYRVYRFLSQQLDKNDR